MMRWIVSLQPPLPVPGVGARRWACCCCGVAQLPSAAGRRVPRVRPATVEVQTACLGPDRRRGRAAGDGPPGAGAQRRRGARRHAVEVGLAAVVHRADLQARAPTCSTPASSCRNGSRPSRPTLPTWAAPPVMIQPLSATSRVMKIGISSDTLSLIDLSMLRATGRSGPAAARARRRQRRDLGRAPGDAAGAGRPGAAAEAQGLARRGHARSTADSLDAGLLQVLQRGASSAPAVSSTPRTSGSASQHVLPIVTPGRPRPRCSLRENDAARSLTIGDVADVVVDHQPLIGDAVINGGPGLMLIVEKLPWGNTLDVTRGVESGAGRAAARPAGRRDRHHDLPAGDLHRGRDRTTCRTRCCSAACWWSLVLFAFLYEWRTALISLVAIPLSLVAAGLVLYWRGTTINTMVLAGLGDRARRGRRRRHHRHREHRAPAAAEPAAEGSGRSTAAVILDASLEVRSADRLRHADHRRGGACRSSSSQGLSGCVLPAAGAVLRARGAGLDGRGADGHAGAGLILLRKAPLERQESPLVRRAAAGLQAAAGAGSSAGRGGPTARSASS